MQPPNQNELQGRVDLRMRTLRILWFALFMSIGLYYILTVFTPKDDITPNPTLSLVLAASGLAIVIVSLLIKQKYLNQSVNEQRVELVQTGYIIAWALCEAAALFGLLDHFLTGNRYYIVLFIIAAGGQLLNFPRRQHVLDASFKSSTF